MLIRLRRSGRRATECVRDVVMLSLAATALGLSVLAAFWMIAAPVLLLHLLCRSV